MITKEMLMDVAKKKGLTNREHMEKDYFQDAFLFHLYKKTNMFVFKGGTCLYKLYNLPRFSEDLDFSLLGKADIEKTISEVADKIGAKAGGTKSMEGAVLVRLGFKGVLTERNSLRIDVSLKNEVFVYDVKQYVPPYIDINPFSLKTLGIKEILAEKIHAVLARESARDLYDLFFILRFAEPDRALVDKKLKIFGMRFDFREFWRKVKDLEHRWTPELRPFVMTELVDFRVAADFVLGKMSAMAHGSHGKSP